jgi:hypothetical protein
MVRCLRPSVRHAARAALVLVGAALAVAFDRVPPGAAQEAPSSVETPGRAVLQVCRSWFVTTTCNQYGHVDVPGRIAIGDRLYLEFGSNPKSMTFEVAAIRLAADGSCTLYTDAPAPDIDESKVDKLTIAACRKAG